MNCKIHGTFYSLRTTAQVAMALRCGMLLDAHQTILFNTQAIRLWKVNVMMRI